MHPPHRAELTCGFLIQLVFCKKCCLLVLLTPFLSAALPPKKISGIRPLPGTLPSNLGFNKTACEQAILSVRLERSKKKQQLREEEGEERPCDLVQSFKDIVYLVPDGRPSSKMKLYAYLLPQKSKGDVL